MSYTISKDFAFEAAHHLFGLPEGHQCARTHGHSYRVRVTLTSAVLDETGFILDYGQLKPFGAWIDANLDHQDLNRVPALGLDQPSAESLAEALYDVLLHEVQLPAHVLVTVGVSETAKTWATYIPDNP